MSRLTLAHANRIIETALATARAGSMAPLAVAVLDAGGHLVAFQREDRTGILRFDIAYGKAYGALGMGFGSREWVGRVAASPAFFQAVATASGGRAVPAPGGVLIEDAEGNVLGAVGISGDTSDKDEACALAGIAAAGLHGRIGA